MANVLFVGIQQMYGTRPDQILFQPLSGVCKGTTLAVPVLSTPLTITYRVLDAVAEARKQPKAVAA